jgi:hypothetical protein
MKSRRCVQPYRRDGRRVLASRHVIEESDMTKVTETVRVNQEPEALWRKIGGFGAVVLWHPMLSRVECDSEKEGSLRLAEGRDGSRQAERLLEIAPQQRFYRYGMETTPMPVHDYIGEFRIEADTSGASTVAWSATFEAVADDGKTADQVRQFFRAGLDNIASLYGAA